MAAANRNWSQAITTVNPNLEPEYEAFFNPGNIRFIRESITSRLKERFPNRHAMTVSVEDVTATMWEYYTKDYQHPQIMIEKIINVLVNQVAGDLELIDNNNQLDPHILNYDQSFGIAHYDPRTIKLNHRKYNNVDFNIRR